MEACMVAPHLAGGSSALGRLIAWDRLAEEHKADNGRPYQVQVQSLYCHAPGTITRAYPEMSLGQGRVSSQSTFCAVS